MHDVHLRAEYAVCFTDVKMKCSKVFHVKTRRSGQRVSKCQLQCFDTPRKKLPVPSHPEKKIVWYQDNRAIYLMGGENGAMVRDTRQEYLDGACESVRGRAAPVHQTWPKMERGNARLSTQ